MLAALTTVLTAASLAATGLVLTAGTASATDTLGASAAQSGRYFGAAVVPNLLNDSSYSGTLNREFNSIVPNAMKWDATKPNRNQFSYGGGDQIVSYARSHGMSVRGRACCGTRSSPGGRRACRAVTCVRRRSTTSPEWPTHYRGRAGWWDGGEMATREPSGSSPRSPRSTAGSTLALANKESLIIGGEVVTSAAKPGQIVPVDSEHSALAQCLRAGAADEVRRLVITASGGPFRGRRREELADVTPEEAMAHPTWDMGPMVTDQLLDAGQQGPRGDRGASALRHRRTTTSRWSCTRSR